MSIIHPALLGNLMNNGGSTLTHLPLANSPIIDAIPNGTNGCGTTYTADQRGSTRPVESSCDKGAVELAINYPPVATADAYTVTEDTVLNVSGVGVLANDLDGDHDALSAVMDTNTSQGVLTFNSNGRFDYTPVANYCGSDHFTYYLNDGLVNSNITTVTLNIVCINDIPIANNDIYTITEDSLLTVTASGLLSNDTDVESSSLTAITSTLPNSGTMVLSSNGALTYTPNNNVCGTDNFSYYANDGVDNSANATVTINIICQPDSPIATNDVYTITENTISKYIGTRFTE